MDKFCSLFYQWVEPIPNSVLINSTLSHSYLQYALLTKSVLFFYKAVSLWPIKIFKINLKIRLVLVSISR